MPIRVRADGLSKHFGDFVAVDDVSFEVPNGEIVALLGPSGCGKTTTLRMIAGFERATSGSISIGGRVVEGRNAHVAPEKRRVGVVFQDYALFPHLDVAANVAFGLSRRRDRNTRVGEMLELVGLEDVAGRYPRELSGGQQQRVALARALAPAPEVILLDEPFSNLDQSLRQRVRADVEAILRDAGVTTVFVTHSQEEALSMADTVCVMRTGRIMQVAAPQDLFETPGSPFVAEFIADATLVPARYAATRDVTGLDTSFGLFDYTGEHIDGEELVLAIRPESVKLAADPESEWRICDREYYGHDEVVTVAKAESLDEFRTANEKSRGPALRCRLDAGHIMSPGTQVRMTIDVNARDVFSDGDAADRAAGADQG